MEFLEKTVLAIKRARVITSNKPIKFVGRLKSSININLKVYSLLDDVFGFIVKNNEIEKLRNNSKSHRLYIRHMTIREARNGTPFAMPGENCINLAVLNDNNTVSVWEMALVSQNGKFFLTQQEKYIFKCYQENGSFRCPKAEKRWPEFLPHLEDMVHVESLPDVSEHRKQRPVVLNGEPGIVDWFNMARGYGFIKTKKGPAFVHFSEIIGEPPKVLEEGQKVGFEELKQTKKGLKAVKVRPLS